MRRLVFAQDVCEWRADVHESVVLILDRRIEEHHAHDIARIAIGVQPHVVAPERVGHEDVRGFDVRGLREGDEIVDDSIGRAGEGTRVAEAHARAIVSAGTGPPSDVSLNPAPLERRASRAGLQNYRGTARSLTEDIHLSAVRKPHEPLRGRIDVERPIDARRRKSLPADEREGGGDTEH
jgi:hypothetical protein